MRLLKCAFEEAIMPALPWALCVVFVQRTRATLVSLAANLRFIVPSLMLPWWGLGQDVGRG
jgi:hypothetical protein